ncbi:S8 family peptidase, partial [Paenibacillus sp. IB182496]
MSDKLNTQLKRCVCSPSSAHARRKLIGFRREAEYRACKRHLERHGQRPHKAVDRARVLCCHIDERTSWQALLGHRAIRYIEDDVKVKAHVLAAPAARKRRPAQAARRSAALLLPRPEPAPKAAKRASGAEPDIPWNISRVQAPELWGQTRGAGVKLAILDTGIASHPDLRIAGGVNTIDGRSYQDDNGHGTHVAGIAAALGKRGQLAGVAPQVRLYAVKALDRKGEGYVSDIVEGVEWCTRRGMQVINMSLGLEPGTSSQALREAVRRARQRGIVVAASAGNSGSSATGIDEPASYPGVLGVAATTRANTIAAYSSRGAGVALAAPGSDIRSTWLGGGYRTMSGTSMAAPHAAGGAALLLARRPSLGAAAARRALLSGAKRLRGYTAR